MISVHLTPNSICKLPVGKQSVDRLTTLNCWRLRLLLPTITLDEDVEDDEGGEENVAERDSLL